MDAEREPGGEAPSAGAGVLDDGAAGDLPEALGTATSREALDELLGRLVDGSIRRGTPFAVLQIGLDNFKRINAALGRRAGDAALRAIAQRLDRAVRRDPTVASISEAVTPPTLCRVDGDEFTLLVPELASGRSPALAAQRLLEIVSQPVEIEGHSAVVTACIGIAVGPGDGRRARELFEAAVAALQQAKDAGPNRYLFHSRERQHEAYSSLLLESRLRRALEEQALTVHYQPRVDAGSRAITGLEALLRWRDPELGTIAPAEFIPLAESSDLIEPLGEYVLQRTFAQAAAWRARDLDPGRVSVNVSPRQFRSRDLPGTVLATAARAGLPASAVEIEITESCLLHPEPVVPALAQLRRAGARVAIDDFGTGFSSLHCLRELPVDVLKIDRAFIRGIEEEERARALAAAIISLAWSLGLCVVAEGVETEGQWAFLRDHGCDEIQGFAAAPALPAAAVEPLLRAGRIPEKDPGGSPQASTPAFG